MLLTDEQFRNFSSLIDLNYSAYNQTKNRNKHSFLKIIFAGISLELCVAYANLDSFNKQTLCGKIIDFKIG